MTDRDIMQQALDALEIAEVDGNCCYEATELLRTLLTQPEQEPVAWMFQHDETGRMNYVSNDGIHNPTMFLEMNPRYALVCPLYTTPPQRTWVGLTGKDIIEMWPQTSTVGWDDIRLIEAKLKEKNA